jgi:hypothetical protein
MGLGLISSLDELRAIVRESFPLRRYEPKDGPQWQAAYERFQEVTAA